MRCPVSQPLPSSHSGWALPSPCRAAVKFRWVGQSGMLLWCTGTFLAVLSWQPDLIWGTPHSIVISGHGGGGNIPEQRNRRARVLFTHLQQSACGMLTHILSPECDPRALTPEQGPQGQAPGWGWGYTAILTATGTAYPFALSSCPCMPGSLTTQPFSEPGKAC